MSKPQNISSDQDRKEAPTLWTVGHSTHTSEDFNKILKSHEIQILIDVRTFPGSRRYPHFNKPELANALQSVGINYQHLPALGGRRRPQPSSRNTAWRNASFRAYADHMASEEFKEGIRQLSELVVQGHTAIMCAEAVWWRCHRGLVADYLKSRGWRVLHIMNETQEELHPYTSVARIVDGVLSYEGIAEKQIELGL